MQIRYVFAVLAIALLSCDDGGTPPVDTLAGRKRELLGALGENVFLPTYRRFADAATALEAATAAYAADRTAENRAAAQQAWIDAMAIWEEAELFVFGPAGPPPGVTADFTGERMLRDEIYSYPFTSTCRIDQETVEGVYADPDAFMAENVNVRGLGAMEYLLFVESAENTCTAMSDINAMGTWAALGADGVAAARAEYAHTTAVLVVRAAAALRDAWEPSGDDFLGAIRTAGDGSPLFATAHGALTELSGAMLYADTYTKDMKVGEPAGILVCPTGTCADQVESPFSHRSREHAVINVRTFRRIYLGADPGTDALGFDDLLVEAGAEDLAAQIAVALDEAVAAFEALEGTLEEAIATNPAAVMTAYDELAEALRLFKADIFSALDIDTSGFVPSDND